MDIDKNIKDRLEAGEISKKDLTEYLVRKHSVFEIAEIVAEHLIEDSLYKANEIILTPKQHQLLLNVLGKITRPLNTNLGRKPKTKKYLEAREGLNTNPSV